MESNHLEPVPLEGYGEQNEGKVKGGLPPEYTTPLDLRAKLSHQAVVRSFNLLKASNSFFRHGLKPQKMFKKSRHGLKVYSEG